MNSPQTENLAAGSITVTKQRTDQALLSFNDHGSQTAKFFQGICEDPILRLLFFLQRELLFSMDRAYPVIELLPLILDPKYDIVKRLVEVYKDEQEKLQEEVKEVTKELEDVFSTSDYRILDTVITDNEVVASLNKRASERKKALERSFEKHKEEASEYFSEYIENFYEQHTKLQKLKVILEYVKSSEDAQKNSTILNKFISLPSKKESLFSSLNKLAALNSVRIGFQSLCLDCFFKYKDEPYNSLISNVKDIEMPSQCPRCKDQGIFHGLIIEYPTGLHKLLMPETHWLQEIIVGYVASGISSVEKVYVHKKIQFVDPAQGPLSGIESDVTIITGDKKLILIEVTTQTSLDNIMEDVGRKVKNLVEKKIPFHTLGVVTSSDVLDEYLRYSKNVVIFSPSHLPKLEDFIRGELLK